MQSIVIFKLCRELRLLKISQVIFHYSIIRNRKLDQIRIRSMSTRHFEGKADRYNGILIDSIEEPCTDEIFANCLEGKISKQYYVHVSIVGYDGLIIYNDYINLTIEISLKGCWIHTQECIYSISTTMDN